MSIRYPLAKAVIDRLPMSKEAKRSFYQLHEVISNIEARNATKAAEKLQDPNYPQTLKEHIYGWLMVILMGLPYFLT